MTLNSESRVSANLFLFDLISCLSSWFLISKNLKICIFYCSLFVFIIIIIKETFIIFNKNKI